VVITCVVYFEMREFCWSEWFGLFQWWSEWSIYELLAKAYVT